MKIALVTASYYPCLGGVNTHVKELADRFAKRKDDLEVEVLTTDPSGRLPSDEIVDGVRVRRFKSWAPHDSYYFSGSLRTWLMKHSNDFDVVHVHSYHTLMPLYAAQAKNKNRLVFTPHYHGTGHTLFRALLHKPYRYLGKRIFEKTDRVICVSHYEKALVLKNFGVDEEKVDVIPNGVDPEEFKGLARRKNDHLTILTVGRLEKYKGMHYLIKVLPRLDRCTELEIVGEGPYKENLIRLSKKLNVDDRVTFSQDLSRHDLLQRYADADVFCLLSEHEAYGISVAEALCARTPCIVANMSALTEWTDCKSCFGIDLPIDLDELKRLIGRVIGEKVGELKIADWNDVTSRLVLLYEEVAN